MNAFIIVAIISLFTGGFLFFTEVGRSIVEVVRAILPGPLIFIGIAFWLVISLAFGAYLIFIGILVIGIMGGLAGILQFGTDYKNGDTNANR